MTAPAHVSTCYRHPDRVAGITCQRCDRPICPECMHQASVGFHCPECAQQGAQREYRGLGALRSRPVVTQILIGLNLLVFLADLATSSSQPWTRGGRLLAPFGWRGIEADGVLIGSFLPEEPWRLVTGGFLHSGLLHVGVNMWSLYVLGVVLEPILGRARFALVYGACLLMGSLGVVLVSPEDPTVGASGAIFGLMGVLVVVARERNVDLVRSGLLPIIGFNLVFTFLAPGISIGGHVGGLVGGVLLGVALTQGPRLWGRREAVGTVVVVTAGVAAAVVAFVLMQSRYGDVFARLTGS